jgi:acetyl esterase
MLTVRDLEFYETIRTDGIAPADPSTLYPLADSDFSGLPPTVVITAQCDPLSSDGQTYRDRILEAGGKAWWHEEPGLVHGFLRARHSVGRARDSFARIALAFVVLGRGDWAW